jgi:hypothetical protein
MKQQCNAVQCNAVQSKAEQGKARQSKAKQGKARQRETKQKTSSHSLASIDPKTNITFCLTNISQSRIFVFSIRRDECSPQPISPLGKISVGG